MQCSNIWANVTINFYGKWPNYTLNKIQLVYFVVLYFSINSYQIVKSYYDIFL